MDDNEISSSRTSEVKKINNLFDFEEGPFCFNVLIESLPKDLTYTCIDSFDKNLYLGSSEGDLLHYFEIEKGNFMLVSRTNFSADSKLPIEKILILPHIERALILVDGIVTPYLLPEFAPVPNLESITGIKELNIKRFSQRSQTYDLYAFSESHIELYKMTKMALYKKQIFDYDHISKACSHNNVILAAKSDNYELIDLKKNEMLSLFKVSESDSILRPHIATVNNKTFLIVSGGTTIDSNSMGFVINNDGEISQSTFFWDEYPLDIQVSYPYIVTNWQSMQIKIFKLSVNDSSKVIQTLTGSDKLKQLKLARLSQSLDHLGSEGLEKLKEELVEKLSLVPLEGTDTEVRISAERAFIKNSFDQKTSLVAFGDFGVYTMNMKPPILDFKTYGMEQIDTIQNYLLNTKRSEYSKFEKLERSYLHVSLLLIESLHQNQIDNSFVKRWCEYAENVDLRLLLDLLGMKTFGKIWIFKGLSKIVQNLKSLRMMNKCFDMKSLLLTMNSTLINDKNKSSIRDFTNVIKSVDLNLFEALLSENCDIDFSLFDENSLDVIEEEIEKLTELDFNVLLKFYTVKKNYLKLLEIILENETSENVLSFFEDHAEVLKNQLSSQQILEKLSYIINSSSISKNMIERVIKILSSTTIDPYELVSKLNENLDAKVCLIEKIGTQNDHDKMFLLNFYVASLQNVIQKEELWDTFAKFIVEYSKDLNYHKCAFIEFISIKMRMQQFSPKFLELLNNTKILIGNEDIDLKALNFVVKGIRKFDVNFFLEMIVLLPEYQIRIHDFLSKDKLLEVFMTYNDFMTIECHLTKDNIVKIMHHYKTAVQEPDSLNLISELLKRNIRLLNTKEVIISVLQELPQLYSIKSVANILSAILLKYATQNQTEEFKKSLVKSELILHNKILDHLK